MKKTETLVSRLRNGLTSIVSQEIEVVDCGPFGSFLASPAVDEFLRQRRFLECLSGVAEGLAEYRMTRPQAATAMNTALDYAPANTRDEIVPPSFVMRAGFSKTAIIRRIAQDLAGTDPIAQQIVALNEIVKEMTYGLGAYLVAATRAPDALSRQADALAAAARAEGEKYRVKYWAMD